MKIREKLYKLDILCNIYSFLRKENTVNVAPNKTAALKDSAFFLFFICLPTFFIKYNYNTWINGIKSRHKVEFLFCLCYNNEKAKLRYIFYIIWNITLGNKSLLILPKLR